jgi:predicted DNA-binding transcriptional regulator YafY
MEFLKLNTYIEQFDSLIRLECTGTADEFAKKLGISDRTLRSHLQQLRELNVNIIYDPIKKTYKYAQKGSITFGFTPDEMNRVKGGVSTFFSNYSRHSI